MARGRKSASPRELVRMTPSQFSIAAAVVVLLMAISAAVGYRYGLETSGEQGADGMHDKAPVPGEGEPPDPVGSGSDMHESATVTFYSVLTKKDGSTGRPYRDTRSPGRDNVLSIPSETRLQAPLPGTEKAVFIQVASFRVRDKAEALLSGLEESGYAGTIVEADLEERGLWFRVRLGPFNGEDAAGKALGHLESDRSLKGFIVR